MNFSLDLANKVTCTETVHQLGGFEAFFFMGCIFITSLVFHELGHYLKAKQLKYYPAITFQNMRLVTILDGGTVTKKDNRKIALAGILLGFAPILAAFMIHEFYFLLIAPYALGCMKDLKEVFAK